MTQSPHLLFHSKAFPDAPDDPDAINSHIHGRALATWLAGRLHAQGVEAGEVYAEDFGWVFEVDTPPPHTLMVVAASHDDPFHLRVFADVQSGLFARLRGREAAGKAALADLYAKIKQILTSASEIKGIEEHVVPQ